MGPNLDTLGDHWAPKSHKKIKPKKKIKELYTRVLKGHMAVINCDLKKNYNGFLIDKLARKYLLNVGLDYSHGTGHGVGLDVVESPDLNKHSDFIFYPKMTLAVKLDLHELEGEGLRVEQVVEITETGARPLNKLASKVTNDWAIL